MIHIKNLNKIVIKIQLLGSKDLKLTLVYLDSRFLATPTGRFLFFKSEKTVFYIYSRKTLAITPVSLRLPTKSNYGKGNSILKNFSNEESRKKWLSKLYQGLLEWSNTSEEFAKDSSVTCNFNGEYWIF